MVVEYPRKKEESELARIVTESKRSVFIYIRGRRRIGKSWILKRFAESASNVFYFSGAKDSSTAMQQQQFVDSWCRFSNDNTLRELSRSYLTWKRIFQEITKYAQAKNKRTTLILDEIQWLAKTGSGCIGSLKEAWIDFERLDCVNVIVCGSSNKFFNDHVGGEEKILRGLQTHAPLQIKPVPLGEVQRYYLPRWKKEEIAIVYMLMGGIPYYLNQLDESLGFISGVNKALFSAGSIFLDEVDEILGMDFNRYGIRNVKKILEVLAVYGGTQAKVRAQCKLSSSTTSSLFSHLEAYGLIRQISEYNSRSGGSRQGRELRYYCNDYFLNSYFALLTKLNSEIARNKQDRNLFAHRILGNQKYYIPNFSGKAFEMLLRDCLERYSVDSVLYKKLGLTSAQFEISAYSSKEAEVDLILSGSEDRIVRVIECKWASVVDDLWLNQVKEKKLPIDSTSSRRDFIMLQTTPTKSFRTKAEKLQIGLIELRDLFEKG